jgi:hypothetical protein
MAAQVLQLSDHIINAGNDCLTHIALLFTAMAFHGTVPDNLLYSTIIPIPKGNKGNVTDSDNFRGIMISSIFVKLANAGVGDNFVGALAYADDIVLLAPSASALRIMLTICDNYAADYSISFNASKSKCLVVLPSSRRSLCDYIKNCIFYVGGKPIEYVNSFAHSKRL